MTRNTELKLLFVCNDGIISSTFAEYWKCFGYHTKSIKCPMNTSEITTDITDWADFIFVINNEMQMALNAFVDPICEIPRKRPNFWKKIVNLKIEHPEQYNERFAPNLLLFIDRLTENITNYLEKHIQEHYLYDQKITISDRLASLLTLLAKRDVDITEICKYITKTCRNIEKDRDYYYQSYHNSSHCSIDD